jgi:hypothetical protein
LEAPGVPQPMASAASASTAAAPGRARVDLMLSPLLLRRGRRAWQRPRSR